MAAKHFILAQNLCRDAIKRLRVATYMRFNTCIFLIRVSDRVAGLGYSGNKPYGTRCSPPESHQRRMGALRMNKRGQRRDKTSARRSEKYRTLIAQVWARRNELGGLIGDGGCGCAIFWGVKRIFAKSISTRRSSTTSFEGLWLDQSQVAPQLQKASEVAIAVVATHTVWRGVGCLIASVLYPVAKGFCCEIHHEGKAHEEAPSVFCSADGSIARESIVWAPISDTETSRVRNLPCGCRRHRPG